MDPCRTRSAHTGQPLHHLYTSHEKVTAPDGRVLVDVDVCSWCCGRAS